MKRILFFTLLVCVCGLVKGQRNADYGVFGGISSYMGDINPGRLIYSPGPAGGIFYRYNFHPRQAVRINLFMGGLSANDLDFNNLFQTSRAASFSGIAGELAAQFEFNFLPYSTQGKRFNYTPYIAAGAGVAFFNTVNPSAQPVIPFSAGFKINILKNVGLEAEYGFRKTFYDNFDGLKDLVDPNHYAWLHNNDWYSFLGIGLTWKIYDKLAGCPSYNDVDIKRKRK